ncbi:hypothetical protein BOTCAL_0115g00130 [Botryotinia calthae]|uniref:Uncharacterized protein n=1 Tax=Botryotinia calthae TaxID=38488 RepID=A0A4Y8D519_9HELO|nr:hypothetical protein BOTCAL_0115g00130 [Botryotinia calthae]
MCLFDLMDEAMDVFQEADKYTKKYYEVEDVAILYPRLCPDPALRRYLLDSLLFCFTEKEERVEKMWSITSIDELLQAEGDLAVDFLKALRSRYGTKIADPTNTDTCIYHRHKKTKRCLRSVILPGKSII